MGKIYKGQIGVLIELDTLDPLDGATSVAIKYKKPSGATGVWPGFATGTKISFKTTAATDLNEHGKWKLQAYAVGAGWEIEGETADFEVFNKFY